MLYRCNLFAVVAVVDADVQPRHHESQIYRRARELLNFSTLQELRQIRELADLFIHHIELADVHRSSIHLYFLCRNKQALQVLEDWCNDGRLRMCIERWFTALLRCPDILAVKLTLRHYCAEQMRQPGTAKECSFLFPTFISQ